MKPTTARAIHDAAMWVSTGAAVCIAIMLTGRMTPLWFFIIPAICTLYAREKEEKKNERNQANH